MICRNAIVRTLFCLIAMKKAKTIAFIKAQCTRIIIGIHHKETTSGFIILMTEPIFNKLHQLTAHVHSLKILIYANTSN